MKLSECGPHAEGPWESSWGLLCSPCSWHSKHLTAKQNQEVLPACTWDRFKATQRDTWKLEYSICCSPVHSSMTWLLEFLGFTCGAESVLCGTWCTHFAGDSWCYLSILHISLLRYQATKNENQKDSIILISWGLSWGELLSNAFYPERGDRNCNAELQHLGLVFTCTDGIFAWIFVLHKEDLTIS